MLLELEKDKISKNSAPIIMGSNQDASVMSVNKRYIEEDVSLSDCSKRVPPAEVKTPIDHKTAALPLEAARKRARVESSHPSRFTAASAHDKGSRVDMEGDE